MSTAIAVENLGKKYLIDCRARGRSYNTLRDSIADAAREFKFRITFRERGSSHGKQEFWALKDASFEVRQGEKLGIIGSNGAGKSTILKLLSRITDPTEGRICLNGRVASLLEVGTGFHPELTGRENIYLNGAILGMTKAEIKRKFDDIVEFSEIDKFLDTPVKRYSSGMYVRLAFAVAAHLEPEILLVDEVLAVGDAAFQRKCLGRMGEVAREGRTILFVSHNMVAVQNLCGRVLRLDKGRVVEIGDAGRVVANHLQSVRSSISEQVWGNISVAPGCDTVRIHRAAVRAEAEGSDPTITIRTPFVMEFDFWNLAPDVYLNLSLHIFNEQGVIVFNPAWNGQQFSVGLFRSACRIPGDLMNDGIYRVELLVVRDSGTVIYRHEDILVFDIEDDPESRNAWFGKRPGAVRPNLEWKTQQMSSVVPEPIARPHALIT